MDLFGVSINNIGVVVGVNVIGVVVVVGVVIVGRRLVVIDGARRLKVELVLEHLGKVLIVLLLLLLEVLSLFPFALFLCSLALCLSSSAVLLLKLAGVVTVLLLF